MKQKALRRKCAICNKITDKFIPCRECNKVVCPICIINNQCKECYTIEEESINDYFQDKYEGEIYG